MMPYIQNVTSSITSNASNYPLNCDLLPEARSSFVFRAVALCILMLMSLIGNGLVCRGATRRRKRPFTYHLVTSLAAAELFYTATNPFHFVYDTKPYSWIFGSFLCHVIEPLTLCSNLVTSFTLATIAVHRFITMSQPFSYHGPSTRVAYITIAVSWIWGIVLSLPDSLTRTKFKFDHCDIFLCYNDSYINLSKYRMAIFFLSTVIPFIVMLLSYSSVICRVKKHIVKTKQESIQLQSNESLGTRSSIESNDAKNQPPTMRDKEMNRLFQNGKPIPNGNSSADSQPKIPSSKMMRLETDVLNMIYLIILLFFLCYLPSNILFILTEGFGLDSVKKWHYYWLLIRYLNLLHAVPSALHPVFYGTTTRLLGRHPFKFSLLRRK